MISNKISKINILKNKQNTIMLIILLLLLVLLFYIINSSIIVINYLHDYNTKNIDNRSLLVNSFDSEINSKTFDGIEHITEAIPLNYSYTVVNSDKYSSVYLYSINDKELSNIDVLKGTKNIGNGNIICPVDYIPIDDFGGENVNISDKIYNTDNLIGSTFIGTSNKYMFTDAEPKIVDKMDTIFTIIGNYDSKKYLRYNNVCFASYEDVKKIKDYSVSVNGNIDESTYLIVVDNLKNIDYVKKEIEKKGFYATNKIMKDYTVVVFLVSVAILIIITVIFVISVSIKYNINRDITNKEKEILLYKSIGYSSKNILEQYQLDYLIIFLISTTLSIIFSTLIFLPLKSYLNNYTIFRMMNLDINIISIVVTIVVGIFLTELLLKNSIRKILNQKKINL